ncbi:hypothetical protein AOLI_G00217390 [Acnodon oligacanthus]
MCSNTTGTRLKRTVDWLVAASLIQSNVNGRGGAHSLLLGEDAEVYQQERLLVARLKTVCFPAECVWVA